MGKKELPERKIGGNKSKIDASLHMRAVVYCVTFPISIISSYLTYVAGKLADENVLIGCLNKLLALTMRYMLIDLCMVILGANNYYLEGCIWYVYYFSKP